MDKIILLLFSLVASVSCVNGQGRVLESIPRAPFEPSGINPQKMNDSEYKYSAELGAYADAAYDRIMKYLEAIAVKPSSTIKDSVVGYWRLQDAEGSHKESSAQFDSFWSFEIRLLDGELYSMQSALPPCRVYCSKDSDIYFVTRYGILKKIIIIEDALYIYVLNDDLWCLDKIHESGKYSYRECPQKDIIRP